MATSVDLWAFTTDARTEKTIRQGLDGRDATTIQRGRLSEALRLLAKAPSPKLVLVDLDHASEPESALARLRAVCSFGTEFVALGSIDTTSFARKLLRDGFSDYLAKPFSPADVRNVCATLLDDATGRDYAGNVIGFVGSGGSGVSALVAAVASEGRARGLSCVVLSFDPIFSESFELEPAGDVAELLLGLADGNSLEFDPFAQDGYDGSGRIALVAYPRRDSLPVVPSIDTVRSLIRHLANRASTVLLCGVPDPELLAALLKECEVPVVLYEPTLLSINVAVRCLLLLDADNPPILVQSHRRIPRSSLSTAHIHYALGDRRPDITLPYDARLHRRAASFDAKAPASPRYRKALKQAIDVIFERIQ